MEEKFLYLTVGNYYLSIMTRGEILFRKINTWFPDTGNPIGEYLGIIEIGLTKENYSDNPIEPTVIWEDNIIQYLGKGCKGTISEGDSAILHINSFISKQYVELFFRVVTAIRIFAKGGLLVHAAGIAKNNTGYLFTGHSGAGKTTVCQLSTNCTILNDDMVILSLINNTWYISSTPFTNESQVPPGSGCIPLNKIYLLNQAKEHRIEEVPQSQAIADLITHVPVITQSPKQLKTLVDRCVGIVKNKQVYNLYFLPDAGFWELL